MVSGSATAPMGLFHESELDRTLYGLALPSDVKLFIDLKAAYSHKSRHYHDCAHIAALLNEFRKLKHLAERPAEIEMAIWFHDAVYEAMRSDNEEASARWAKAYLSEAGAEPDAIDRINQIIIATKTHQVDFADGQLMVDLDLGILGTDPETFEAYDRAIRKEYALIPGPLYRGRRAKVLASFLERDAIFKTPEVHARLEAQARDNLSRKIAELTR